MSKKIKNSVIHTQKIDIKPLKKSISSLKSIRKDKEVSSTLASSSKKPEETLKHKMNLFNDKNEKEKVILEPLNKSMSLSKSKEKDRLNITPPSSPKSIKVRIQTAEGWRRSLLKKDSNKNRVLRVNA